MLRIDKIQAHFAFQPFGLFVAVPAPGATLNFLCPFVLVAAHHAVVDHHQTPAALKEPLERRALFADDFHAVLGVDYQHIGVLDLFRRRKLQRAVRPGAARFEQLLPLREKPRVIVLVRAVGFDPGTNEHAERRLRLGGVGTKTNEQ